MQDRRKKTYRTSGLVWPIVLILVGVVFLLNNLGLIDAVTWESIWKYWPLIFVAIGLDGLIRRSEIVGPVIMFSLGAAFLLNNLGWGWNSWSAFWRLWPILIVAVGLEIMVGRRSPWLSALGVLAVAVLLVGLLWLGGLSLEPRYGQPITGEIINQEIGDASKADIDISQAAGEMNIDALEEANILISGAVSVGNWQEVRSEYKLQGTTAFYFLRNMNSAPFPGGNWEWELGLTPDLPMELDVSMGAGDMNLDLHEIKLSSLDASQGVGDLSVTLPAETALKGDISQAIGQIVIYIPENVAVRIEVSKAIANLDIPSDFDKRGDTYYSPGYESAAEQIDLSVSQAIGNIAIRYGQ